MANKKAQKVQKKAAGRKTDSNKPVRVLAEDLVLVDWGPTTLTISAWYKGKAVPVIAAKKLYRKNLIRGCLLVVKSGSSLLDPEGIVEYPTETWA